MASPLPFMMDNAQLSFMPPSVSITQAYYEKIQHRRSSNNPSDQISIERRRIGTSELKANSNEEDLDEKIKQFEIQKQGLLIAFVMLMVHAGKMSVDFACKCIKFDRDHFLAICKEYKVNVNDDENELETAMEHPEGDIQNAE